MTDKLYRSGDGGNSWTPVNVAVPAGYDVRLGLPTFSTPSDGVLVATLVRPRRGTPMDIRFGGQLGTTFMVSHDGGQSWAPTRVFADPHYVAEIISAKHWIVAHIARTDIDTIETTIDGGTSWTEIHPVGLPAVDLFDFVTPLIGWARPSGNECVGVGQTCSYSEDLMVTTDGGNRWTTIDLKAAGL